MGRFHDRISLDLFIEGKMAFLRFVCPPSIPWACCALMELTTPPVKLSWNTAGGGKLFSILVSRGEFVPVEGRDCAEAPVSGIFRRRIQMYADRTSGLDFLPCMNGNIHIRLQ